MNRRSFLKALCAAAGIAAVPSLGVSLPSFTEPEQWIVEEFDFGYSFGVGAKWPNGARHAVQMIDCYQTQENIEYCKQALRQWYAERHRKAA